MRPSSPSTRIGAGRTWLAAGGARLASPTNGSSSSTGRPSRPSRPAPTNRALVGPFDFAFIDALKGEYPAYLEAIVPRLLPGAIVVADNVLWSGGVSGDKPARSGGTTEAIRAFDTAVLRDRRFRATILPVGDGLLIAAYRG